MMAKRKPINVWKVCYVKIRCDGVRYKVKIKTHDTSVVYLFHNRDEVIQFLAKYIANVKVLSQKPQLRGLYYTITLIGKIHVDTLTKLQSTRRLSCKASRRALEDRDSVLTSLSIPLIPLFFSFALSMYIFDHS